MPEVVEAASAAFLSRASRWGRLALMAMCFLLFASGAAWAQNAATWPPLNLPENPTDFAQARGEGYYFSMIKIVLFVLLFFLWVKTTDWVSQDCFLHKQNYALWNSLVFGVFFFCVLLVWMLPWFALSYFLLLAGYAGPLAAYIVQRNITVDDEHKVLTPAHLRRLVATVANKVGIKMEVQKKAAHELGPEIKFVARGGENQQVDQTNEITARQSPGFLPARELIDQASSLRASSVMLDYTASNVGLKFQIDGVWHNYNALEREKADPMLAVFKTLANLKVADRVSKQHGRFGAEFGGQKYDFRFQSQGTQTGEAAVISFDQKKLAYKTLDELGMRAKMQEQVKELLGQKSGFFLVSSVPAGGLTTTFDVLMSSTDRFMRNFVAIEESAKAEREIENIPVTRYDARLGETLDVTLAKLIRTYPDVFVIRDLVSGEVVDTLAEQVTKEDRLVFANIRAKEAAEALLRVLLLKATPEKFAAAATAVLNVRLIRKLCDNCKESYPPPAELLRQLGLPPDKVQALYRPPTPPPPGSDAAKQYKPCEECMQIGYRGRTAIFELLVVDDRIRQILTKQPKIELLRDAARKAGNRNLQDEGALLVVRGITSVQELVRVLKQ